MRKLIISVVFALLLIPWPAWAQKAVEGLYTSPAEQTGMRIVAKTAEQGRAELFDESQAHVEGHVFYNGGEMWLLGRQKTDAMWEAANYSEILHNAPSFSDEALAKTVDYVKTGQSETVAGVKGEVFTVKNKLTGAEFTLVLTTNPDAARCCRLIMDMYRVFSEVPEISALIKKINYDAKTTYGVLKIATATEGDSLELKSLRIIDVPETYFDMPLDVIEREM